VEVRQLLNGNRCCNDGPPVLAFQKQGKPFEAVIESKNGCLEDGPDISVGLEFNGDPNTLNRALQAFPFT
jgi:hypothetical protein